MFNAQQRIILLHPLLPTHTSSLRLCSPNRGNRILAQNQNEPNRNEPSTGLCDPNSPSLPDYLEQMSSAKPQPIIPAIIHMNIYVYMYKRAIYLKLI